MNSNFFPRTKQQTSQGFSVRNEGLSAVTASSTGIKNYPRSSAGTISAPAAPRAAFKNCCMQTGRYDGAPRNHYHR